MVSMIAASTFLNNIKTQIARMDNLLFFALLSLLCMCACLLMVSMIKAMARNDGKFKLQITPVLIFILLMAFVVLLAVCRFA